MSLTFLLCHLLLSRSTPLDRIVPRGAWSGRLSSGSWRRRSHVLWPTRAAAAKFGFQVLRTESRKSIVTGRAVRVLNGQGIFPPRDPEPGSKYKSGLVVGLTPPAVPPGAGGRTVAAALREAPAVRAAAAIVDPPSGAAGNSQLLRFLGGSKGSFL